MRLTLAMQTRTMKELTSVAFAERCDRRRRIQREVEHVLGDTLDDEDEIERLSDEARECLSEAEDDPDFATLPFAEAVARICAGLGLDAEPSPLGEAVSPQAAARILRSR